MINFRMIVITLLILIFESCKPNEEIFGKYVNKSNTNVENYLQLNKDNTYLHYYKDNVVTLKQSGKWIKTKNSYASIELFDFCNYNEEGRNFKKFGIYLLIIDGRYLNNGFDGDNDSSFLKK